MIDPIVKQILNTAVYAPSGDNSQPWKFEVHGLNIKQFNIPGKDNPIFNFKQRGSFIAHGAVLQNIILLSKNFGHEAQINLFPNSENLNFIAEINLIKKTEDKTIVAEELIDIIKKRETNRKLFKNAKLSLKEQNSLTSLALESDEIKLLFTEEKNKILALADAASTAERVMLEYKPLHDDFFNLIRWNKNEEKQKKYGMLIDTLELLPPQKIIFRWFSNWRLSSVLRKINLPKFIAKENSKTYASAPIIGAIIIPDDSPKNYIKTGMLLQKIWLKTTELELGLQPIVGVLYLAKRLRESELPELTETLKTLINCSSKKIHECFNNSDGTISMMFRIGRAEPASAHSIKCQPEIKEK